MWYWSGHRSSSARSTSPSSISSARGVTWRCTRRRSRSTPATRSRAPTRTLLAAGSALRRCASARSLGWCSSATMCCSRTSTLSFCAIRCRTSRARMQARSRWRRRRRRSRRCPARQQRSKATSRAARCATRTWRCRRTTCRPAWTRSRASATRSAARSTRDLCCCARRRRGRPSPPAGTVRCSSARAPRPRPRRAAARARATATTRASARATAGQASAAHQTSRSSEGWFGTTVCPTRASWCLAAPAGSCAPPMAPSRLARSHSLSSCTATPTWCSRRICGWGFDLSRCTRRTRSTSTTTRPKSSDSACDDGSDRALRRAARGGEQHRGAPAGLARLRGRAARRARARARSRPHARAPRLDLLLRQAVVRLGRHLPLRMHVPRLARRSLRAVCLPDGPRPLSLLVARRWRLVQGRALRREHGRPQCRRRAALTRGQQALARQPAAGPERRRSRRRPRPACAQDGAEAAARARAPVRSGGRSQRRHGRAQRQAPAPARVVLHMLQAVRRRAE
mmetsp:Transcript_14788/g.31634  ORF Transcript_14788/g.31634 Transcript_14788/m.31634 type:complete len:512 (+) Transcript_14788:713-2248(+)